MCGVSFSLIINLISPSVISPPTMKSSYISERPIHPYACMWYIQFFSFICSLFTVPEHEICTSSGQLSLINIMQHQDTSTLSLQVTECTAIKCYNLQIKTFYLKSGSFGELWAFGIG